MANHKLDIFTVLEALDRKDVDFYQNLSADEQKSIHPFVLMRWLSGTFNKTQVFLLNEVVNQYIFNPNIGKDLSWKLLTICTTGKKQRYTWSKPQFGKSTMPTATKAIQEYFGYNRSDAADAINLLDPNDIILIGEELGWQDEELNTARKELNLPTTKISKSTQRKKTVRVTNLDIIEL